MTSVSNDNFATQHNQLLNILNIKDIKISNTIKNLIYDKTSLDTFLYKITELNIELNFNNNYLFYEAVRAGNYEIARYLIDLLDNIDFNTGLKIWADFPYCEREHKDIFELLISHGADINCDNNFPIKACCWKSSDKRANLLKNHGCEITVELILYGLGSFRMTKWFIDSCCDLRDHTEIHARIWSRLDYIGIFNTICLLLENGLDTQYLTGADLLCILRINNFDPDLIAKLRDHGADFTKLNSVQVAEFKSVTMLADAGVETHHLMNILAGVYQKY